MANVNARKNVRRAALALVAVLMVVLIANSGNSELVIFGGGPSYDHKLQLVVPSAFEVIKGERVTEGGVGIGSILSADVTRQARAHIVIGVSDSAWPVPTDSTLTLRMGGTIKYTDRFIEISKGHAGSSFADDATVPASQFVDPVEYDQLFNIFNARTRQGFKQLFDQGGPTLQNAAQPLHRALGVTAPALGNAAAVFGDLGYDQHALSTLVSSTASLSDAIAASNPGVRTLIDGAANTFTSLASQSTALQTVLTTAAPAFRADAATFRHAASDLPKVATLADRLSPGVTELDRISAPLSDTLRYLVRIEPLATHTLHTVTTSAPSLDHLLTSARTNLFPQLQSVANQGAEELDCIRPYTPELSSLLTGWAGWESLGLNNPHVHILHGEATLVPFPNTMPIDSRTLAKVFPNMRLSYPAAPGENFNQPWYQPQCGVTASGTDPAHDSDAGTYDPNGSKTVVYPSR
jgi:ABC-type transporter Mla subunit MlaD